MDLSPIRFFRICGKKELKLEISLKPSQSRCIWKWPGFVSKAHDTVQIVCVCVCAHNVVSTEQKMYMCTHIYTRLEGNWVNSDFLSVTRLEVVSIYVFP